jgi:hypothetical protein
VSASELFSFLGLISTMHFAEDGGDLEAPKKLALRLRYSRHPMLMTKKAWRRIHPFSILFIALFHPLLNRAAAQSGQAADTRTVQVEMKNVTYHFSGRIAAHIIRLQGQLVPTRPGALVVFDDRNSFTLSLASAEIAISCNSSAQVLNEEFFPRPTPPSKALPWKAGTIGSS